eukprot:scaffold22593_cov145-Cylindrotheca_fusiformis.AAC.2
MQKCSVLGAQRKRCNETGNKQMQFSTTMKAQNGRLQGICSSTLKYSKAAAIPGPGGESTPEQIPQLYSDTIASGFGEDADLYDDVLKVSSSAPAIELRIAYFKRGREIMKEAGSLPLSGDPEEVPELVRTRFQAVSMAYEILSNPQWKRLYLRHGLFSSAPARVVRFSDDVEKRIFQLEPWEEEYSMMRKERRKKKNLMELEADRIDDATFGSMCKGLVLEMGGFQLEGCLQVFPDKETMEGQQTLCESQDAPEASTQDQCRKRTMPSWLSPSSFQPVPTDHWGEDDASVLDEDPSPTTSSFNPFRVDSHERISQGRSPTSFTEELVESMNGIGFPRGEKDASGQKVFSTRTEPSPLLARIQKRRELQSTAAIKEAHTMGINMCARSDSFVQRRNLKLRNAPRSTSVEQQEKERAVAPRIDIIPRQRLQRSFIPINDKTAKASKPPTRRAFNGNDDIFEGLDDVWNDSRMDWNDPKIDWNDATSDVPSRLAGGLSTISDISESVVIKTKKRQETKLNPLDDSIVSASPFVDEDSSVEESSSEALMQQQISSEERAGFAAKLAASVVSMVPDCRLTGSVFQTMFSEDDGKMNEAIENDEKEIVFSVADMPKTKLTSTMAEF